MHIAESGYLVIACNLEGTIRHEFNSLQTKLLSNLLIYWGIVRARRVAFNL